MRCVIFDFGGTLDGDGRTWLDRFHLLYAEAGVQADFEAFRRAFYRADDALAARHDLSGASLEETLLFQVGDVLEILSPQSAAAAPRIAGVFLAQSRRYFSRNRGILERLRGRYALGVVSNFYGNLESVLRSEGLLEFFSALADSAVVGAQKPAPEIFRHALRALSAPASECLMVGDSLPRDMRGAEAAGMPHAWLEGGGAPACCLRGKKLSALTELEALLA